MLEEPPVSLRINEDVFRRIYLRHWQQVYIVCYNNIRDSEIAKGMVQDIFKSLWERREDLEITVSIERYLLRSAKFKVFEYLRNKTIHQEHLEVVVQQEKASRPLSENDFFYNNLKEQISSLIEALPKQCRNVFRLSREQGLSNKEIAKMLEISERAVEYHITRALSDLKSNLSEYFT